MGYFIEISDKAKEHLKKIKKNGRKSEMNKITNILKELELHPRTGTGKPERLKNYIGEIWSRRINKKDRLVYEIFEEEIMITIISSLGHYEDK